MDYSRQLRHRAWQALSGKWNIFYPIMLFSVIFADAFGLKIICTNFFSTALNYPVSMMGYEMSYVFMIPKGFGWVLAGAALAFLLAGLAMNVGEYRLAGHVLDGEKLSLKTLFPAKIFLKALIMNLLQYLIISIGLMLFIVPGIVFACNYAMANYLLATNPELGPIEALRLSRERMYGKRVEYLSVELSFIPWALAIYIVLSIVSTLVYNLTWSGDVIYSLVSWATTAFLTGYMRVTVYAYFRDKERNTYTQDVPDDDETGASSGSADAAAEAEARRAKETEAEKLYRQFACSHNALSRAGRLEYYRELGLSGFREEALRRQYGRELMVAFDSDPGALDALLALSGEYAMDDLIDRAIARVYRFEYEGNAGTETVLTMAEKILTVLHSGAFASDPGFAARKQTDILKLADTVKAKCTADDPEGAWRDIYRRICDMCGIEEE